MRIIKSVLRVASLAVIAKASVAGGTPTRPPIVVPAASDEPARRRYEFLPVPTFGGNSDIGVEGGVAFTLARFYDDERPYRWLLSAVASTSFKDDVNGFRPVQQYQVLRLDVPNLFSDRVRLDSRLNFLRSIDAPYYGVGNASVLGAPPANAEAGRQHEYVAEELRLNSLARVKTGTPFEAAFAIGVRYEAPETYSGSKLVEDAAHSGVAGTEHAFLSKVAAGVIIDTRDNEFVPQRGVFYQLGVAGTKGSAERVAYGEAAGILSTYIPLARPVTLATRVVTSFEFGRVPFYDLQGSDVFVQQYMVGGSRGVRGVRLGRYAGHVKLLANYEVRTAFFPRFRVANWQLQIGTTTFFDAGRVWSDYHTPELDGSSLGVKYGVGGGFSFRFDESTVFRVETAYSPDNNQYGGLPLAFYAANNLIF